MQFGLADNLFQKIVDTIRKFPVVEKAAIFGSRAIGNYKSYSDIDIAIYAPTMSDQEFALLWNELNNLPIIYKMDIVHCDKLTEVGFKNKIQLTAKTIYIKDDQ